jgi:glycosyltransferase involved in cell wall biosynthesis
MRPQTLALCIPAYNAAEFLPRLLQSAAKQTSRFDEILVYDDASPDHTAAVARQWGAQVIHGAENRGCSEGKNLLAAATACDWIHFHDADDDIAPDFVERARRRMANPACPDIVLFNYEYRDIASGELIAIRHFDPQALATDPLRYAITEQINPFCGLYRKAAFLRAGGYDTDPAVLYNEDCAFHLRMALAGLSFGAEDGASIINLRRPGSMSSANQAKCVLARLALLRKTAHRLAPTHHLALADELWRTARHLAHHQRPELTHAIALARRLGRRSPQTEPRWVRALSFFLPVTTFRFRAGYIRRRDHA